jgi:hypothetical protein
MESPQFAGKAKLDAMLVKTLNLSGAIATCGLDHAEHTPALVTEECVRVLDPISSLREGVFADPEVGQAWERHAVVDIDRCQPQVVVTVFGGR